MKKILQKKNNSVEDESKLKDNSDYQSMRALIPASEFQKKEKELGKALLDPNMDSEKKDALMLNLIFSKGLESASFLGEMFRYKGQHTKETRVFKSQMRSDFTVLVSNWSLFLRETARAMFETYVSFVGFNAYASLEDVKNKYFDWIKSSGRSNFAEFDPTITLTEAMILLLAVRYDSEADFLDKQIKDVYDAREREKGKGIFVDSTGRAFDVNEKTHDEIVNLMKSNNKKVDKE